MGKLDLQYYDISDGLVFILFFGRTEDTKKSFRNELTFNLDFFKVHIFWEGHKILENLAPVKSKVEISQNFVAFLEYMNFNKKIIKAEKTFYLIGDIWSNLYIIAWRR